MWQDLIYYLIMKLENEDTKWKWEKKKRKRTEAKWKKKELNSYDNITIIFHKKLL